MSVSEANGMISPANGNFGLICGGGKFPMMVALGAKRAGHRLIAVGLRDFADPGLSKIADEFYWTSIVRLGQMIRILRRRECRQAILAGSVRKTDMYARNGLTRIFHYLPDWTSIRLWFFKTPDKRNDSLLTTIANEFAEKGIVLESCIKFTPECMAPVGVLTSRKPSPTQQKDIEFGWRIAKELGRLDIGQSVAVKELDVIAVEAIEGTDRMIERAGTLCKAGGWCHIKVGKPNQDMRFDVPTIGPDTINNLHNHGAKILCIEAHKTFIVDKDEVIRLAEKYGMIIIGWKDNPSC